MPLDDDIMQRLAVIGQIVRNRKLWSPCASARMECLSIPMGNTGFNIKYFRDHPIDTDEGGEEHDDSIDDDTIDYDSTDDDDDSDRLVNTLVHIISHDGAYPGSPHDDLPMQILTEVHQPIAVLEPERRKPDDNKTERRMAWRLDSPNNIDIACGPIWTCSLVWNPSPTDAIRDSLLNYLYMLRHYCEECGLYSPDVSTFQPAPGVEKKWCTLCTQAFIAGTSVEGTCAICMTEMVRPYESICGHMFHRGCAVHWISMKASMTCPVCRQSWDMSSQRHNATFALHVYEPTRTQIESMQRNL